MIDKTFNAIARRLAPGAARLMGRFCRDTTGAVAVMVVLLVPVLIGMMGLTVDVSLWYMSKRSLQNAADAAAVSGSMEIVNGNPTAAPTAAKTDAIRNGFDESDGSLMAINIPPTSGPNAGNADSIEVIITRPMPIYFLSLFIDQSFVATARAVANAVAVQDEAACFVSLNETSRAAIDFGSTQTQLTGCGIKVNSNFGQGVDGNQGALEVGGSSSVTVIDAQVSVVGGIAEVGTGDFVTTEEKVTGSTKTSDPFADIDVPDDVACEPDKTNLVLNNYNSPPPLEPGVYCGGLTILNSSVEFLPGNYIIKNGDLNFQTQAQLVGDNVVFILTGDNPADIGSLDINSNAQLQFTPPDDGDFAGIMFFQDRDALPGINRIRGQSQLQTDGAFYFPSQDLQISGDTQIQVSSGSCGGFVADTLSLVGGVQIQIDCDSSSQNTIFVEGDKVSRLGE